MSAPKVAGDEVFRRFLERHLPDDADQTGRIRALYHAVRNIPYGSTGERHPTQVIASNVGSCSGKHILLRDLLRASGRDCDVITIFTHFSDGVPAHPAMPPRLIEMLKGEPIVDFHHYVRVRDGSGWQKLDATWHDGLRGFGFPVNDAWRGEGDTVLASQPIREYPPVEDVAEYKVGLIASIQTAQRVRREEFFRLLTDWIADRAAEGSDSSA